MKYSEIVLEIKLKIENNVCNCFRIYTKFIQMYVMINKRSICIIYEFSDLFFISCISPIERHVYVWLAWHVPIYIHVRNATYVRWSRLSLAYCLCGVAGGGAGGGQKSIYLHKFEIISHLCLCQCLSCDAVLPPHCGMDNKQSLQLWELKIRELLVVKSLNGGREVKMKYVGRIVAAWLWCDAPTLSMRFLIFFRIFVIRKWVQ